MRKTRIGIATVVALFLISAGAFLYKYESDKTAWSEVQSKLIRLDSGLQYEPIVLLRSKLADADASSKEYSLHKHIFPPRNTQRISDAEQAISYLDAALTLQADNESLISGEMLESLEKYGVAMTLVPRRCVNGYLQLDSSSAQSALYSEGLSFLRRAESSDTLPWHPTSIVGEYPQLDFVAEQEKCWEQEQSAQRQLIEKREAAERAQWLPWRYHVEIKTSSEYCAFASYTDGNGAVFSYVSNDDVADIGVNKSLALGSVVCRGRASPPDAIRVRVNGKPVKLNWISEAAFEGKYGVNIIPGPK